MQSAPTPTSITPIPGEARAAARRFTIAVLAALVSFVLIPPARSAVEPAPAPGVKADGTVDSVPGPRALDTRKKPDMAPPPSAAAPETTSIAPPPAIGTPPLSGVDDLTGGLSEHGTRFVSSTALTFDAAPPAATTLPPAGTRSAAFDPLSPLGLALGGGSLAVLIAAGWYLSRRRT
jgi:hypothetical protein